MPTPAAAPPDGERLARARSFLVAGFLHLVALLALWALAALPRTGQADAVGGILFVLAGLVLTVPFGLGACAHPLWRWATGDPLPDPVWVALLFVFGGLSVAVWGRILDGVAGRPFAEARRWWLGLGAALAVNGAIPVTLFVLEATREVPDKTLTAWCDDAYVDLVDEIQAELESVRVPQAAGTCGATDAAEVVTCVLGRHAAERNPRDDEQRLYVRSLGAPCQVGLEATGPAEIKVRQDTGPWGIRTFRIDVPAP